MRATKSWLNLLLIACLIAGTMPAEAFARGGLRGGGRVGGGGARIGGGGARPSMGRVGGGISRSPSLSRPAPRPSIGSGGRPGVGGGSRPSIGGGGTRPGIGSGNRPSVGGGNTRPGIGTGSRPSVGAGNRPGIGTGSRPGVGTGNRPDFGNSIRDRVGSTRPGARPDFGNSLRDRVGDTRPGTRPGAERPSRGDLADRIRNDFERPSTLPARPGRPDRPSFDRDWWQNHIGNNVNIGIGGDVNIGRGWGWHRGWVNRPAGYWWGAASFTAMTAWLPWASTGYWATPAYCSYGTGGDVYYEGDTVYVSGSPVSAGEYYEQAAGIAAAAPEEPPAEDVEWLPLGVFAIAVEESGTSHRYLQLAISKEGVIAGTFYNELTDSTRPIEGTVDQQTQRAAFTFADGENTDIVMETTLGNLSKDESTALVHFGDVTTQTWLLVRLEEPEG